MIRVFLLDDHEVVRRGLTDLLHAAGDIDVVGESGSAREATARIPALRPDVRRAGRAAARWQRHWVLERIRNGVEQPRELAALTDRERRILEYIAEGLTNRDIAGRMFLAEKTVKNHVSSLLAKLGLERRTQAAVPATRLLGDRGR
jgi:DNA-binding NarL/FixJ family response regulator